MSRKRSSLRSPSILSKAVHQRLNSYALLASAAGVGVLAFAQPADAKIIYTPAYKKVGTQTFLDLNNDGIHDFRFTALTTQHCQGSCTTQGIRHGTAFGVTNVDVSVFRARPQNAIYGQGHSASALPAGVAVGPHGKFPGGNMMANVYAISGNVEAYNGPWAGAVGGGGVKQHYLGLRFTIAGKVHFGWARLNVKISGVKVQTVITGYAYETIPFKAIVTGKTEDGENAIEQPDSASLAPAPEPATLASLALGSRGLAIWRREESVTAN